MKDVDQLFTTAVQTWSDIHEHLERLRSLGSECSHITEFGVREGVSTIAWAAARPRTLVCYDLRRLPEVDRVEEAARAAGVDFFFHEKDVRHVEIAPTDLLFIDTLHVYEQLRNELSLHAGKVQRYIVLHDTETFGEHGETPGSRGIWPAVAEFLAAHGEWQVRERRTNNNGLTVLTRS